MAYRHSTLTQEQLKSALDYDPATGYFTWKRRAGVAKHVNSRLAGNRAGSVTKVQGRMTQYVVITINGNCVKAHRLAWLYVYGHMPKGILDHINGDGTDNRIVNLRPCTLAQNARNHSIYKRNTSGFSGVRWCRQKQKWQAYIRVNYQLMHLGFYNRKQPAVQARLRAEREHFGEWSRAA